MKVFLFGLVVVLAIGCGQKATTEVNAEAAKPESIVADNEEAQEEQATFDSVAVTDAGSDEEPAEVVRHESVAAGKRVDTANYLQSLIRQDQSAPRTAP